MEVQSYNSTSFQYPSSMNLSISSYGFGGIDNNNILFTNGNQALIPIGPNIGIWDLDNANRTGLIQANTDSIYVMLETMMYIVSISFGGSVSILNKTDLSFVRQFHTKGRAVNHASINEEYLSIVCLDYIEKYGIVEVYKLSKLINNPKVDSSRLLHHAIQGTFKYATLADNDNLITVLENTLKDQNSTAISEKGKKPTAKKHNYTVLQYNLRLKRIINKLSLPHESDILSSTSNSKFGIYLYQSRHILILNLQNIKILSFTSISGTTGPIMTSAFMDKSTLVLSPVSNYLLYVNCTSLAKKALPAQIEGNKEFTSEGNYEVKLFKSSAVSPARYFLKIVNGFIFSANEEGFIYQNMTNPKQQKSFSAIGITATSIATNPNASLVAVGDIIGNVFIYPADRNIKNDPLFQVFVMSGIRSLDWDPNGKSVAIGTMDGTIYRWWFDDQSSQPQVVSYMEGSITTLRFKKDEGKLLLLTTTTEGQFAIFEDNDGIFMKTKILVYGHLPQEASDQFGSLFKFAEIWGSTWNSNGTKTIATSSEDQTVHIFDLSHRQPNLIYELKGHELAVTAVDWKRMNDKLGDVFISCSDDQTIRVYNPQNKFELVHIFSTSFVNEWHTLTYLSLEEGGTRVAIGAQNGYLFIYDLLLKKFVFAEKIHMGGIEGVAWKNNRIFTCSNDCTVNIVNV